MDFSETRWRGSLFLQKYTIEITQRFKAAGMGDVAHAILRKQQQMASLSDAQIIDVVGKSSARRFFEEFAKVAFRHTNQIGHFFQSNGLAAVDLQMGTHLVDSGFEFLR